MKRYRSRNYPNRSYAYSPATGWIMFPAVPGGWTKREPARGIDPIDIREVPLDLAFDCGVPGSPTVELREAAANGTKGKVTCTACKFQGCVGRCHFERVDAPPRPAKAA